MSEQDQSQEHNQNIPKKKAWYKRWWAIALGIVIILIIIGSARNDKSGNQTSQTNQQSGNSSAQTSTPAEPAKPVEKVTVSATTLISAYKDNEVAADDKYKGKLLTVSGEVSGVDNGIMDNELVVRISNGEQYSFDSVNCYAKASEKEKIISLKKGSAITVEGMGDSATIGSPTLKNCTIK